VAKGFGMDVYAFDPFVSRDKMVSDGIIPVDTVEELYKTCQYVSLHIPATEKTKKSINYDLLSQMPKGAVLINTARKEVIHEEELVKIMEDRADFKYISDIEPGNKDVFVQKFGGRFFFTPKKSGAQTEEANINAGVAAARQIVGYFKNGDETFRLNK
jgi:D-3-phosphoglycerate dehydrogenase